MSEHFTPAARDWLLGAGTAFRLSRGGFATEGGTHLHVNRDCPALEAGQLQARSDGKGIFARVHITADQAFTRGLAKCHQCWPSVPAQEAASVIKARKKNPVGDSGSSKQTPKRKGDPDDDARQRAELAAFLANNQDEFEMTHVGRTAGWVADMDAEGDTASLRTCPNCDLEHQVQDIDLCPLCREDISVI